MKVVSRCLTVLMGIFTTGIFFPAYSQVISDGTTNTTINSNGNSFTVINGIQRGNNLFHSFNEFSIPTGGSVIFDHSSDVGNIVSRITGGKKSSIDGLIKAHGRANLFLINPAGIIFEDNARLDIGGSFLGTTAENILFADGLEFSAVNLQDKPLLTVSIPVGLQMGKNPGNIKINGNGHQLITATTFSGIKRINNISNLQVSPGNTLALMGGGIKLNGGIITAESGRIELGALAEGFIKLDIKNQDFFFDYLDVKEFQDIQLSQNSLVDASGKDTGSIQVQGANISLNNGSKIWIQNRGSKASGNLNINASESLTVSGNNLENTITSSVTVEVLDKGRGGDINISGQKLLVENGARISNNTYSLGKGGHINLNLSDSVKLMGTAPITKRSSFINTSTVGVADSGSMNLSTKELTILDGGVFGSLTQGSGNASDVIVDVSESIEVNGVSPILQPSGIFSSTLGSGNAGNLNINTKHLAIKKGGRVDTSTVFVGDAGSIIINASESIEVSGVNIYSHNPSLINSSANIVNPTLRKRLGLPDKPFGASGNLEIITPHLTVTDGALVNVRNDGFGNGGTLKINANSLNLDKKGRITAATEFGEAGNISLNLQNHLILRNNSLINTEAKGIGNGGNITINSPVIAAFENSDIIANAVEGDGGNINITTQGIFGLVFRQQQTNKSDITASSQFGVNGTVDIKSFGTDPSSGLVELPITTTDTSQQIAAGCGDTSGSSFIATGRGGIPTNPNQDITNNRTWSDIRDISAFRQDNPVTAETTTPVNPIIQATGWRRNAQGQVELIAENSGTQTPKALTCAAVSQS